MRVDALAEDPDGHRVRFEYTWIVNGRPLRHAGKQLAADRLAVGDRVEVEVRASDGVEKSASVRLGPVTRANSLPEITSLPPAAFGADRYEYRVEARDVEKLDGPFMCPKCGKALRLRKGEIKAHHFAHCNAT